MLTVILLTVMVTGMLGSQPEYKEKTKLKKDLFRDYKKNILPRVGTNHNVTVNVGLYSSHIVEVDPSKEEVSISIWADLSWKDARLSWDPAAYGGVDKLLLPPSLIWVPDMAVYEGVHDSDYFFTFNALDVDARIWLMSTGDIRWFPAGTVRVRSKIEDAGDGAFKFSMKIGSWSYHGLQVDPRVNAPGKISTQFFHDNNYEIVDSTITRVNKIYEGFHEPYPHILVNITLKKI